ncbi:Major facilitator superfamily domain, general substrate transporter [Penicillium occitanis (nom. inval.)]|nr:Major facilitator superfamily domain, general substrate transporter [Penicillium occitanis (nom. inval.)]PCH06316.1 hypothetical protein PENOC_024700 [Penicillium occitanis (nom. inval.)]
MAPKEIRGQLGSMFQFFFILGVTTSYWMDYGVSMNFSATSKQWQIPVAFQLVPGGLLGLGMLLTRESTRWLAKKGRREEAMASLMWVRGTDSIEVQEEFAEIIAGIEKEQRATEGFTWKEFFLPANRYRMFVAVTMQIGVQLTGNTSLAYSVLTVIYPPKANAGLTSPAIASLTMIYLEAMTYDISWDPVPWLYMSEIFPTRLREGGIAIGTATQWLFNFVFSQITPHATKGKSLEEMEQVFKSMKTAIDFEKVHHDVHAMFHPDDQKESAKHVE